MRELSLSAHLIGEEIMRLIDLSLPTRITAGVLVIVFLSAMILIAADVAHHRDTFIRERSADLKSELDTEKIRLDQAINTLRQDTLFLSNIPPVSGIVRAALNHGYDARDSNTHARWERRMLDIFSAFSIAHPEYYQIRFIGVADGGRELVRIDNRTGKIEITARNMLQAKGNRDYFKATVDLRTGEVSLSEFNLNQERGVIEQPPLPTLRASTPIFTPTGKLFGMIVINMKVAHLLKLAESDIPGILTYVTNRNGKYLLHPDTQLAFKFDYGNTGGITTDFPFIKPMFNLQTPDYLPPQAVSTVQGSAFVTAKRIYFDPESPSRFLLLMHYLPAEVVKKQTTAFPSDTVLFEFLLMLLMGVISMLALRSMFSPLKQLTVAAEKISTNNHDISLPPIQGGEIGSLTRSIKIMLSNLSLRELELKQSENRYRSVVSALSEGIMLRARDGMVITWNNSAEHILGLTGDQLQKLAPMDPRWKSIHEDGTPFPCDVHPGLEVLRTGISQLNVIMGIYKSDETLIWISINAVPIFDQKEASPTAVVISFSDITERKAIHAALAKNEVAYKAQTLELKAAMNALRSLATVSDAELEEEKKFIARELHDELGQLLTALRIEIGLIKMDLAPKVPELIPPTTKMLDILNRAVTSMRGMVAHLRPIALDMGLVPALEWLKDDFIKMFHISCVLKCSANIPPLNETQCTTIFRITQELLTNVVKHSGARMVHINLQFSDDLLQLSVQDNGIGFDQAAKRNSQSFGLMGIDERMLTLNGELVINTAPNKGCCVTLNIPMKETRS